MSAIEQLKTLKKEIKRPYIPLWELSNDLTFDGGDSDHYYNFDEFVNDMNKMVGGGYVNGWNWGNSITNYSHQIDHAMAISQWKDERKWEHDMKEIKLEELKPEQQEYLKKIDVLEVNRARGGCLNGNCVVFILTNKEEEPKIRKWLATIFKEIDLLSG